MVELRRALIRERLDYALDRSTGRPGQRLIVEDHRAWKRAHEDAEIRGNEQPHSELPPGRIEVDLAVEHRLDVEERGEDHGHEADAHDHVYHGLDQVELDCHTRSSAAAQQHSGEEHAAVAEIGRHAQLERDVRRCRGTHRADERAKQEHSPVEVAFRRPARKAPPEFPDCSHGSPRSSLGLPTSGRQELTNVRIFWQILVNYNQLTHF